ncbi:hypothetical protein UTI89_C1693 [Escherichia coli UTI89]|uniref:Uncharacterized protein n=1 Tax=Escherichia coli (strain UTI89 / UPEC) TaxID=364106 RepID=Q1RBU3_ECOUT|nr:hypothetical protein UTI89_C1693 [Escherichia coli UTI89]
MALYKVPFFYCVTRRRSRDTSTVFSASARLQAFCRFSHICGELPITTESFIAISGVKAAFPVSNRLAVEGAISIALANSRRLTLSSSSDS